MTRFSVILVIVCALGLGVNWVWKANDNIKRVQERVENLEFMTAKGTVVYALSDIEAGSLVTSDSVESRLLMQCKMPDHVVCHASDVIGRRPIYKIEKGQLLSYYDFLQPEQVP